MLYTLVYAQIIDIQSKTCYYMIHLLVIVLVFIII